MGISIARVVHSLDLFAQLILRHLLSRFQPKKHAFIRIGTDCSGLILVLSCGTLGRVDILSQPENQERCTDT